MIDAIIISDTESDTFSASSPLRLQIDGRIALIQNVRNFLENHGKIITPVVGENKNNWHGAPKLNGIRLLSYLTANGFAVELIDSYYQERNKFIDLLKNNPKAVIISTTFIINKKILTKLVADIRSLAPDIVIIVGGPFVLSSYLLLQKTAINNYDLESPKNDYLFLSHEPKPDIDLYIIDKGGEQILAEALGKIQKGQRINELPNTAKWDGKEYAFSNRIELPPLDIGVDWQNMPKQIFAQGVINIQASIGCPCKCEFCNFVKDRKYTLIKPLSRLVQELKAISAKGIKYVRFVDDNFRLGRNDLNEVCQRFIDEGLDLKWMSFIRASTLDKTDLDLLQRSGCIETQIGIESADREVLKNMNKNADPDMYYRVISRLLEVGISCSSCFIVGFPGETADSFQRTVDFIETVSRDSQEGIFYWSIYPFLIVPLSPIYEPNRKAKYNLTGYMDKWEHRTMNSKQAYEHIKNVFFKIKNATPIYSGDNIEMLLELPSTKRKEFMKVRHQLSRRFMTEPYSASIAVNSFSKVFGK